MGDPLDVRRIRSHLRPARLAGRAAVREVRDAGIGAREIAYTVSRQTTGAAPWGITRRTVALAWFRGLPNFGDEISPLVMRHLTGYRPRWVRPDYRPKVVGVGSLMAYARPSDIIIGTGMIRAEAMTLPLGVRVLGLRGPRTADLLGLGSVDIPFGDPGLLAADALGISKGSPSTGTIGVVPHYVDRQETFRLLAVGPVLAQPPVVIDVRRGPRSVIEEIAGVDVCVSTSLHGLIVAESLGIPAIWASMSENITGGSFKFNDYYEGTGRPPRKALGLHEALDEAAALEAQPFVPDTGPIMSAFGRLVEALEPH